MIMTKVFNSLFVIIAAMVIFAGCAKQEVDAPATPETKTVQFFANSIETKTVFGTPDGTTYPTLWTTGDKVKVHVNLSVPSGVKNTEASVDVKLVGGEGQASSAMFTAELNDEFDADSYTIYSVNPSVAWNARSGNEGRFTVVINDSQTPLTSSVDPAAQVLYAISDPYTDGIPESVNFEYKHFTAYGKLSFKGLADGVVISKVKLESEDIALAGKWNYYVADGTVAPKEGVKSITLETSSKTDIWFACAPVDVSNKTLTLTVTTDKGDFVKPLNFPADRKFEAGKISKFTVDMAGIEVEGSEEPEQPGETTEVWTLVTDASTLAVGDKIVIAAATEAYALAAQNNNNRASVAITKSSDKNTIEINDDVQIITLKDGNKASTFAFYTDEGYLYAASGSSNHLKTKTTLDDNGSWNVTISNGVATIKAQGTSSRNWLRFNSSNSPKIFSCYGSGQNDVSIYRLEGANEEGGETPVISVTSETTIEVPAAGGNINIEWSVAPSVEDVYLEATEDVDWISPATRSTVSGNLQYTVEENSGEARTATITLAYTGAESKTVTVKQAAKVEVDDSFEPGQYWIVANEKYAMPLTGNYGYLQVDAAGYTDNVFTIYAVDGGYTIQQPDGKYLYMTGSYDSFNVSTAPSEGHVWTIAQNEDGSYKILNVLKSKYVQLDSQYGTYGSYNAEKGTMPNLVPADAATARPVFSVTPASKNVACDVTEASFDIVSNQNWTIVPGEGVTVDVTSGSGNGTITMTFAENKSEENVIYTAIVKADGLEDIVLTVVQSGIPTGDVTETVVDLTWTLGSNAYDGSNISTQKQTATINGVNYSNLLKLGTSSKSGSASIKLPAGTTKVTYSAVAWKGASCTLKFTVGGTEYTQKISANNGATGNPKYTITSTPADNYELVVSVDQETTMTVTTTTAVRAILWDLKAVVVN